MEKIKTAFKRYNIILSDSLPCDSELGSVTVSERAVRRAELILDNVGKRQNNNSKMSAWRVVGLVLIIMALFTTVAFAVGQMLLPDKKFEYKTEKNETAIVFDGDALEDIENFEVEYVSVGYVPSGFSLDKCDKSDIGVSFYYYNAKKECLRITQQYKKGASISLDTNGNDIKLVKLDNDRQGLCYTSFDRHTIIFEDKYYYYMIRLPSRLAQSEAENIANSLTFEVS